MTTPKLQFKDDDGRGFSVWSEGSLLQLSESGFSNGVFNDPLKVGKGYKLINVLDMYIESIFCQESPKNITQNTN